MFIDGDERNGTDPAIVVVAAAAAALHTQNTGYEEVFIQISFRESTVARRVYFQSGWGGTPERWVRFGCRSSHNINWHGMIGRGFFALAQAWMTAVLDEEIERLAMLEQ